MLVLTVVVKVKPEHVSDFSHVILRQGANALAKEEGCLQFEVSQDPGDPTRFFLYEVYADQAAFDAHGKTPHFADYRAKSEPWLISRERTVWKRLSA